MQLFHQFERILGSAESVEFTIRRHDKGLEVISTPRLKDAPTDLSDEDAEFRGALAMPLYVCCEATTLDEQFFDLLGQYTDARESLASTCGVIDNLREAGKQAKTAEKTLAAGKSASKDKSTDDDGKGAGAEKSKGNPGTAPAPSPASNPDSLF